MSRFQLPDINRASRSIRCTQPYLGVTFFTTVVLCLQTLVFITLNRHFKSVYEYILHPFKRFIKRPLTAEDLNRQTLVRF